MPHPYLPRLVAQLEERRIDRREFLRTATLLGVAAPAAYALASRIDGGAAFAQEEEKPKGGTLRISTTVYDVSSPPTATTTAHPLIYSQVVEYLTKTGADNVTRPHLLESWEPSEDLKTWTLKVRPGVKWHDGSPFTADDVVWNLTRLLSDEVGSSVLGLMKGYILEETESDQLDEQGNKILVHSLWAPNAIERVDDMTVRLNLKAPQLAVPEHLFHYPAVMLHPSDDGVFGPGAKGTGAFTLASIEPGRSAVLKAVEGYWGEGPYLDGIEFVDVGGNEQALTNALVAGQVDGAFETLPDFFPILDQQPRLVRYEVTTADTAVTRMNVTQKPFDDPKVRKAFRLAIDPAAAAQITFQGFATPAEHHHVSPIHPEYAQLPPWTRDVAAAKALLAEAGFPEGVDAVLTLPQNPPHHLRNSQVMQQMWAEAGIRVELNVVPNAQYWDVWMTAPMGCTVWAHRPLGVMNLSLAYRSGVPWNESGYANPEFDRLMDEAEAMPDPEVRRGKMAEIEALMQEDGPIVQSYWRNLATYFDRRVVGFAMHPTYMMFLNEVALKAA